MADPTWEEKKDDINAAIVRIQDAQTAITQGRIQDAQAALTEALKLLGKVIATDPGDGTGVRSGRRDPSSGG
jgi:hypothetical protein